MALVLLGYPDDVDCNAEYTAFDNFIGGYLVSLLSPDHLFYKLPSCPNCNDTMSFLMQLYCPVDNNHRVLYFFSCLRNPCQKDGRCWRVLKQTKFVRESSAQLPRPDPINLDEFAWKLNLGDNDLDDSVWFDDQPKADVHEIMPERSYRLDQFESPFACRFINVFDDAEDAASGKDTPCGDGLEAWVLDYRAEAEFNEEEIGEDVDGGPRRAPITSHFETHLATRNSKYGCEALRYSIGGLPIFASDPPRSEWATDLACSRCGSPRIFEVQLFPTINNFLTLTKSQMESKPSDINANWPLDMATLLVFTCKNQECGITESDDWVEECALVQTEGGRSVFCA